ncbi:MAG: biotin--[Oscillospiraceae bacterium]|nr:biotin--[acetyl-CoA-carboxylase] ligase [Oscillospiraceae bacterium]
MTEQSVREYLKETNIVGRELRCFAEIGSTNDYLKTERDLPDGTVVTAEAQSAGRGRRGRSFESAAGVGIYLSALLKPALSPDRLMPLTGLAAVAAVNAIERVCGLRAKIKWTNDLVLNGRKLAGILTELKTEQGAITGAVVGIGINVNQCAEDFGAEVGALATSLRIALGREVDRAALTAALIEELDALYAALLTGDTADYLARYRRDCLTIGAEVQLLWQDTRERVQALDVDESFGLVVRRGDGSIDTIRTGEVSVRGLYGYVE